MDDRQREQAKILFIIITLALFVSLSLFAVSAAFDSYKNVIINNWSKAQLTETKNQSGKVQYFLISQVKLKNKKINAESKAVTDYIKKINYSKESYVFFYNENQVIFDQNDKVTSILKNKTPREAYNYYLYNGGEHFDKLLKDMFNNSNGTGYFVKNYNKGPEYVTWSAFESYGVKYVLGIVTPEPYILNQYKFENTEYKAYIFTSILLLAIVAFGFFLCFSIHSHLKSIENIKKENIEKTKNIELLKIELNKEIQRFKLLSIRDPLTEVYSRKFFDAFLKKVELNIFIPVSIILFDINGLNLINNTFGYEKGDLILKEAANTIKNFCRDTDIVARYGNDEFVTVLTNTTQTYCEDIARKIKISFDDKFVGKIPVTLAFGADTKGNEEESVITTLENAEVAMNSNKLNEEGSIRSSTVSLLQKTLHERSIETSDHCMRMRENAVKLGNAMNLSKLVIGELILLASLHDVGKIAISDSILNKKDSLTKEEYEIMKSHPQVGYDIAMSSRDLRPIAKYILQHHERWDGAGYPFGIKGNNISKQARIISIIDSYDAMVYTRSYSTEKSIEMALKEIEKNAGTQFDPEISKIFIDIIKKENNL